MGETGCGKTSLVRFLACGHAGGFQVINHAGVKEHHILEKMEEVVAMAGAANSPRARSGLPRRDQHLRLLGLITG